MTFLTKSLWLWLEFASESKSNPPSNQRSVRNFLPKRVPSKPAGIDGLHQIRGMCSKLIVWLYQLIWFQNLLKLYLNSSLYTHFSNFPVFSLTSISWSIISRISTSAPQARSPQITPVWCLIPLISHSYSHLLSKHTHSVTGFWV